jgi:GTP-binding protein
MTSSSRPPDFARKLFAGECEFVAGAATIEAMPPPRLPEIAFAGRSNAGKSSLINALTGARRSRACPTRRAARGRSISSAGRC